MIELVDKVLNGVLIIKPKLVIDNRGKFAKIFQKSVFEEYGVESNFSECFYSISKKNVIRGMHFQLPPHDHAKLIYCMYGNILDVILDLRKNSPTYGQWYALELNNSDNNYLIYIPRGFAHGFKSLKNNSIVVYLTSSEYSVEHDSGVRWDSFGFDWGIAKPIISERDRNFVSFDEFVSPFVYEEHNK